MEKTDIVPMSQTGEIVLYQPDNSFSLEVRVQDETVWLTQQQMVLLFQTTKQNVSLHINNIFKEGELERESVVKEYLTTARDGKRYKTQHYNLDVIISVGYRVKSRVGTRFRQWANGVLKDYLLKGYAVQPSLKQVEYHLSQQIAKQNEQLYELKQTVARHDAQLAFIVKGSEKPTELIIPTGCVWDAYTFVCDLVRSAKSRVVLVDNFADERTLLVLDKRAEGVTAEVHTRYTEQTMLDFEKHNSQYARVEYVQLPQRVHDRYLIVDDTVWLLGSSVKDMGHGLCTIIQTGFAPEMILGML